MNTKLCSTCKKDVPLSKFAKHSKRNDGKQTSCQECKKKQNRKWYEKNKDTKKLYSKLARQNIVDYLNKIKLSKGCKQCGYKKNPAALHFHHCDSNTKLFNIGQSKSVKGLQQIKKEIKKCDILCANCHAEITWPLV